MSARRAFAVPLLLAMIGILLAAGFHALRPRRDPRAPDLPSEGSVVRFRADDLGRRLREHERTAVWRLATAERLTRFGRRRLGWNETIPSPATSIEASRATSLALYRGGWLVLAERPVFPADGVQVRSLREAWAVVGPERFASPALTAEPVAAPPRELLWVSIPASIDDAGLLRTLLPIRAEGTVARGAAGLAERWQIRCDGPSLLDLLVERASGPASSKGWSALPEDAQSVGWVRLVPERLTHLERALAAAPEVARAADALEAFVGVPARAALADALDGPALLAVRAGVVPRMIAAFDLASPAAARTLVERVLAIGALSETVRISRYRGVTIGTWVSRSGSAPVEPAVAVDGDLLLLGTDRAEVEAAVDRRRDPRPSPRLDEVRRRLDRVDPGAWRAWSRSPFTAEGWERLLGSGAREPAPPFESVASLRREDDAWVLEGGGTGAAVAADPILPALRWSASVAGGTRRLF